MINGQSSAKRGGSYRDLVSSLSEYIDYDCATLPNNEIRNNRYVSLLYSHAYRFQKSKVIPNMAKRGEAKEINRHRKVGVWVEKFVSKNLITSFFSTAYNIWSLQRKANKELLLYTWSTRIQSSGTLLERSKQNISIIFIPQYSVLWLRKVHKKMTYYIFGIISRIILHLHSNKYMTIYRPAWNHCS